MYIGFDFQEIIVLEDLAEEMMAKVDNNDISFIINDSDIIEEKKYINLFNPKTNLSLQVRFNLIN